MMASCSNTAVYMRSADQRIRVEHSTKLEREDVQQLSFDTFQSWGLRTDAHCLPGISMSCIALSGGLLGNLQYFRAARYLVMAVAVTLISLEPLNEPFIPMGCMSSSLGDRQHRAAEHNDVHSLRKFDCMGHEHCSHLLLAITE